MLPFVLVSRWTIERTKWEEMEKRGGNTVHEVQLQPEPWQLPEQQVVQEQPPVILIVGWVGGIDLKKGI